ncbi:hypothetical protein Lal_00030182 [Lupinus albus]|nr:hypothetical protein Lal_00030182 [Lupinus albus]
MDLDLTLRLEKPISTPENLDENNTLPKKNEREETSNLLGKLISVKYKGKGNIREYIIEMSNLVSKLKSLKLEFGEDLLMHLVLISLPAHFGKFKVSYNTQEEERLQRDKTESAHLIMTSQNKKRKNNKDDVKELFAFFPKRKWNCSAIHYARQTYHGWCC